MSKFKEEHNIARVIRKALLAAKFLLLLVSQGNVQLFKPVQYIQESPPQFENGIMARVYVRSITRSTILLAVTGVWKMNSVACGFSSIKIDYSDYPKSLISRINEVYVLSIKYRYSDILLKKHKPI